RKPKDPRPDDRLRAWLIAFSKEKPKYGYRRHRVAVKNGFKVNRKKVQRIWKEEGLRVTRKAKTRSRRGTSDTDPALLEADRPDHVWALDFQDDQTADGHQLRFLNVVDEVTRQALAVEVDRPLTADRTVQVLKQPIENRRTA